MTVAEPRSLADHLAELRRRRGADGETLALVRDVVVVGSSSRGGSTMLGELLRHVPGTLHLPAELNPLVTLADGDLSVLADEVSLQLGRPGDAGDVDVDELSWRLLVQWPDLALDPARVQTWVELARHEPGAADPTRFQLALLRIARAEEPRIDPWYYDLPDAEVARAFPHLPRPSGPPGSTVIEMAPFVRSRPWRRARPDELATRPVVLTTPRNAFRLPLLQALFPNARLRLLHLTRNPAAAANGLVDGWRHRGFFSTPVDRELRIAGYSERGPWGSRWWNFDLVPGWEDLVDRPLESVCAHQWAAPHRALLASDLDRHVLRFEDVTGPAREAAFARLQRWLDLPGVAELADLRLAPLMATAPPAPRRWTTRAARLLPALREVADVAAELGYGDPATWR